MWIVWVALALLALFFILTQAARWLQTELHLDLVEFLHKDYAGRRELLARKFQEGAILFEWRLRHWLPEYLEEHSAEIPESEAVEMREILSDERSRISTGVKLSLILPRIRPFILPSASFHFIVEVVRPLAPGEEEYVEHVLRGRPPATLGKFWWFFRDLNATRS